MVQNITVTAVDTVNMTLALCWSPPFDLGGDDHANIFYEVMYRANGQTAYTVANITAANRVTYSLPSSPVSR